MKKIFLKLSLTLSILLLLHLPVPAQEGAGDTLKETKSASPEERYKQALALIEDENYNEAYDIMNKLFIEDSSNNKYQVALLESVIMQGFQLKNKNNMLWKEKAREAEVKIKSAFLNNAGNPDYYIAQARYLCLIERYRSVEGAFKKAFHFRPEYLAAHIAKGDVYTYMAKKREKRDKQFEDGTVAKEAYEAALRNPAMTNKTKALTYYKLGMLETTILYNSPKALGYFKKTVELYPEGKIAAAASAQINKYSPAAAPPAPPAKTTK